MLTQLKTKELILLIQDGFHVLTVFAPNPDLVDSLKSELSDLKELVSGKGLDDVLILVQKLNNLLKVIPQNTDSNTPAFTAENIQFIFEALRIISSYLESGIPPRGINVSDIACVLDILYQDKVAAAEIPTPQTRAAKSLEENQKPPLILQVDSIKETLFQNPVKTDTTNQITEEGAAAPAENKLETPVKQNEEEQESIPIEPKLSIFNESTEPQIETINPSNLETSEPIAGTEKEQQESQSDIEPPTMPENINQVTSPPPDNGRILIVGKLEGSPIEEIRPPLSLEQILEISESVSLPTDSDFPPETNPMPVEIDEQTVKDEQEETQIELPAEQNELKEITRANDSEVSSPIESKDKFEVESAVETEQPIEIGQEQIPVDIEDTVWNKPEINLTKEPAEETVVNHIIDTEQKIEPSAEPTDEISPNEDFNQIQTELPVIHELEEKTVPECSLEPTSPAVETETPIQESQTKAQKVYPDKLDSTEMKSVIHSDTPCLIIKINHQAFALPYQVVDKVDKFGLSDLKLVKNEIVTFIDGEDVPMFDLATALGYSSKEGEHEKETFLAAICRTNGKRLGILFDEIVGFESLEINTFNTIIGKMKGIAGYSVYKNGNKPVEGQEFCQPVLVIELSELI